ncbi:MAG: exodeoxyribonuclease V subunit beta [Gammaproteobacteria bacterium]|nr:exodeoxyribonuclease V subunit beta [Gammaproteobacteria bacterium]NNF62093.1 exodeoxyribonuclease V subunit beta [Gammaproteobacteria bacterium]
MSRYQALDVMTVPLQGISLVEANAGTGKTYNIVAVYLRLLLEAELTVDQILVVSFTEAATAELRERIRSRLQHLRTSLETGDADDDDQVFMESITDRDAAIRCITRALQSFDQAAIYTIHAFCQRLLTDAAFEAGLPLDATLVTDDDGLRRQVVEDFWHAEARDSTPEWVQVLVDRASPARLMRQLGKYLGRPPLHRVLAADFEDDDIEQRLLVAAGELQQHWRQGHDEICAVLNGHPGLYKTLQKKLAELLAAANTWSGGDRPTAGLEKLAPLAASALAGKTKKGFDVPQHNCFERLDEVLQLAARLAAQQRRRLADFRARLLAYAETELPRRKRDRRVRHFDDLLRDVYVALHSPRRDSLVQAAHRQYAAALIDEFQDTDPLQFAIFATLFARDELPVFFVGDPKQAIYAFRGADVHAYLDAREHADRRYRLDRNYRSTPELVAGINAVFSAAANPFVIDSIGFSPSAAAKKKPGLSFDGVAQPALRWWHVPAGDGKRLGKPAAELEIAAAVASDIVRVLEQTLAAKAGFGDGHQLRPRDIAVLVNTNEQGAFVRDALATRGVDSMQRSTENVFGTLEADELFVILRAVVEPAHHALVRAALATRMLGYTAGKIVALDGNEQQWQELLDRFSLYPQLWRQHGFARMFRRLCRDFSVEQRVLQWPNGQRTYANLMHLAELLQRESALRHGRLDKVLEWMRVQQRTLGIDDESMLLRLESDENLVNIITIHLSKGLQFPVVYCPYLWNARTRKRGNPVIEFHDNDNRPVLDLGSDEQDSSFARATVEDLAERVRLAYVAMTRAEVSCTVVWGRINTANEAGLTWLLHGRGDPAGTSLPATDEELLARLQLLAAPGVIVEALPEISSRRLDQGVASGSVLQARSLSHDVPGGWRVASFSALTRDAVEQPHDYDAVHSPGQVDAREPEGIYAFPRGARAGRCMHHLLENISFRDAPPQVLAMAQQSLAEHGFDEQLAPVLQQMALDVLATPLDGGGSLRLRDVEDARRVTEMEFYFPLKPLRAAGLADALGDFATGGPIERRLEQLNFRVAGGFMHGYIDLVFEADGRYYLADHKSNWLGNAQRDYSQPALAGEIARHDYYLQYLIYSVALNRHLRRCVANYDYRQHFGGVYYLFLRGMRPDSGPESGVYHDRPGADLMKTLEKLFCGDPGE